MPLSALQARGWRTSLGRSRRLRGRAAGRSRQSECSAARLALFESRLRERRQIPAAEQPDRQRDDGGHARHLLGFDAQRHGRWTSRPAVVAGRAGDSVCLCSVLEADAEQSRRRGSCWPPVCVRAWTAMSRSSAWSTVVPGVRPGWRAVGRRGSPRCPASGGRSCTSMTLAPWRRSSLAPSRLRQLAGRLPGQFVPLEQAHGAVRHAPRPIGCLRAANSANERLHERRAGRPCDVSRSGGRVMLNTFEPGNRESSRSLPWRTASSGLDVGRGPGRGNVDRLFALARRACETIRSCSTRSKAWPASSASSRRSHQRRSSRRFGQFEGSPGARADGAGERALLVAKKLALEQRVRRMAAQLMGTYGVCGRAG